MTGRSRPGARNRNPTRALRSSRGFTLVELLVVIAIISIIAGFLIPTLIRSRGEADKVACQNNLREISKMGMLYADTGHRFFPYARGGKSPHEHMNVMVEFFSTGETKLKPELFICRSWRGEKAEVDEEGKFLLDEESCSYTWSEQRLTTTDQRPLSSDKFVKDADQLSGHELGMNVVDTAASVSFVLKENLDEDGLPKGLIR